LDNLLVPANATRRNLMARFVIATVV
jgi:hypothetical protein